jgi:hypothetical protein
MTAIVRYCWRNPPYPSFSKGGDLKAPFAKRAARSAGGFGSVEGRKKTFASSILKGTVPLFSVEKNVKFLLY